jgi:DNA polymerase-3 subunit alpha
VEVPPEGDAAHELYMPDKTPTKGFVHLHVHTEYSPLDGMTNIGVACAKVASEGQTALAITDHGNLGGAWQLNRAAKKHGIKPLIGAEVYLAVMADPNDEPDHTTRQSVEVARDDESAADDDVDERGGAQTAATKNKKYEHLTVFATTPQGWTNLASMMDVAEAQGFYAKPRIDYKLLAEFSEGLIVLTGCLGGPVLGPVSRGNIPQARQALTRIIAAVGRENVYVEIMEHGIPAETAALPAMVELAAEFDLPLVATNDAHYAFASEAETHEAWLAVQSGKTLTDPKRFQFHGAGYHLRTEAEMRELRSEDWWQTACDNTLLVADRFEDDILPEAVNRLPVFPIPDGFENEHKYIVHLAKLGWAKRSDDPMPENVKERLRTELGVIGSQGFISYFLIVWDLVKWAREDSNIPGWPELTGGILVGPGRGSAAGSMLSYLLEIVDVDPIANNLLFERFLEEGREDMPDIDLDFEQFHLERVQAYLAHRWGADKVARIGTHNVAQTKAAIKDAARVLELPAVGAKLTRVVPTGGGGKNFSFDELQDVNNGASEKFRTELKLAGVDGDQVVALARQMVGTLKGEGIHACGIIISTEALRGLIPLRRDRSKSGSGGLSMVTAWDAPDVGDVSGPKGGIGLLKLDVLSIRNLDIVAQACKFIEQTTGEVIDPRKLPHPDTKGHPRVQATWSLIKAGRTAGVFQMDSTGMQAVARSIAPDCLTDLSAIVALFRPGPLSAQIPELYADRKAGRKTVDYHQFTDDPAEQAIIASVLGETYGVWVFQEQLMRLGAAVAGFTTKQRNLLRKAVGKKDKKVMDEVSALFADGAVKEFRDVDGNITSPVFSRETAGKILVAMQGSADYLFNASHSAAYAQLAYVTAYLKANWPAEYGAAILATTSDNTKRLSAIEALTGEGIEILRPDVNLSAGITSPVMGERKVRLGLSEIKGVGQLGAHVVKVREFADGRPFTSLGNLVERLSSVEKLAASIASIEGLVEAGACDDFGPRLGQLMVSRAVKNAPDIVIPDAEFSILEKSIRQRSRLGASLGVHPLKSLKAEVKQWQVPGNSTVRDVHVGNGATPVHQIPDTNAFPIIVSGLLAQWTESAYSKGQRANITIEGSSGRISGVMWDSALKTVLTAPVVGSLVAVRGIVTMREQEIEDEDGVVIETLRTKELNISRFYEIPVDNIPTGSFVEGIAERAEMFRLSGAALPPVPVMAQLALKTVSRKKAASVPSHVVVNASTPDVELDFGAVEHDLGPMTLGSQLVDDETYVPSDVPPNEMYDDGSNTREHHSEPEWLGEPTYANTPEPEEERTTKAAPTPVVELSDEETLEALDAAVMAGAGLTRTPEPTASPADISAPERVVEYVKHGMFKGLVRR